MARLLSMPLAEVLDRVSPGEFRLWMAYLELEPLDGERVAAQVAKVGWNAAGGSGSWDDWFINPSKRAEERYVEQDPCAMFDVLKDWVERSQKSAAEGSDSKG